MVGPARPLIAVVGPTASGKSALALRLAEAAGGEVVSCDSLQVYRGFDVGSAKAAAPERARVRHHLLDVADAGQPFSAADYARLARAALEGIADRGALPVVAGGTGLYLRALLEGLFEGPARDGALRARFERMADRFGDARLHRLLGRVDPAAAARTAPRDRIRVVRALEVYWTSGRPITEHQRAPLAPLQGYRVLIVGLDPPRDVLRAAVEERTDAMLGGGLLDEVRALRARHGDVRPLHAIGYRQALALLDGEMGEAEARRDMVADTMRYAKRQLTWFRHQADVRWFGAAGAAFAAAREWLEPARG